TLTLVKGTLKLMAWTKAKVAIAVGAGVLLVGGTTGTLVFNKWEAYKAYRASLTTPGDANADPEAWRNPTNDFAAVQNAAPQVKILPSKFQSAQNLKGSPDGLKWVGIGVPVRVIAWVAYDCRPARVVFDIPRPSESYDFITSLPQGSLEALQQEL